MERISLSHQKWAALNSQPQPKNSTRNSQQILPNPRHPNDHYNPILSSDVEIGQSNEPNYDQQSSVVINTTTNGSDSYSCNQNLNSQQKHGNNGFYKKIKENYIEVEQCKDNANAKNNE